MPKVMRSWSQHGINPVGGYLCGCCYDRLVNSGTCHCPASSHPQGLLGKSGADDSIREILPGPWEHEPWCDRVSDRDADCSCEYDPFSSTPCEGCGTLLAGERFTVTLGVRNYPTMR